jgi:nucleotide-binding universal stress UspA family protein
VIRDLLLGSTAEKVIRKANVPVLVVNLKPLGAYHRPVVALDLEDTARWVVELALRSLPHDVRGVSVIHAYTVLLEGHLVVSRISPRELNAYRNQCRREALSGLQRVLELAGDGVDWRASVRRGDPRIAVMHEIGARRADLVVLGTHGRSGLSHALLGSVAEHVVRTAACDVLVAPPARFALSLP